MEEMHESFFEAHAKGPLLAQKIMRAGYYWLTMENDFIKHVRTCHHCQVYQNRKNVPPQPLNSLTAQCPFSAWGMDFIKPMILKASNGQEYILVAIDYFTKWVEAASYKSFTQAAVAWFLKLNIICRYACQKSSLPIMGRIWMEKWLSRFANNSRLSIETQFPTILNWMVQW